MTLIHGASIYDVKGQNVCLTDSLTITAGLRPAPAHLLSRWAFAVDWQYPGAILL